MRAESCFDESDDSHPEPSAMKLPVTDSSDVTSISLADAALVLEVLA